MSVGKDTDRLRRVVLRGADADRTARVLALAVILACATALLRVIAPGTPGVGAAFGILHAFTLEANPAALPIEGFGVLTLFGLAAIRAYLNKGHVPSLVLATAPSYGNYVFNGPGAAPVWAAEYVLPFALTAGPLGFLVGVGRRWYRRRGGASTPRRLSPG